MGVIDKIASTTVGGIKAIGKFTGLYGSAKDAQDKIMDYYSDIKKRRDDCQDVLDSIEEIKRKKGNAYWQGDVRDDFDDTITQLYTEATVIYSNLTTVMNALQSYAYIFDVRD